MFKIIKKIFYNEFGAVIISIILGIGLASLFRKACKDRQCILFKGPPLKEIKDQIYKHEENCYLFKEKSIKCGNKEKSVDFA